MTLGMYFVCGYRFVIAHTVGHGTQQGAWRKTTPTKGKNETTPPNGVYNMGGPCVRTLVRRQEDRIPPAEEMATECAKQLESLNQMALDQIRDGSPNGLVVEYRQLPEVRLAQACKYLAQACIYLAQAFPGAICSRPSALTPAITLILGELTLLSRLLVTEETEALGARHEKVEGTATENTMKEEEW